MEQICSTFANFSLVFWLYTTKSFGDQKIFCNGLNVNYDKISLTLKGGRTISFSVPTQFQVPVMCLLPS